MTTEITVTCDGCQNPIEPGTERVHIVASEIDTGQGITSQPAYRDYHPECLPTEAGVFGYKHGSLIAKEE